jgi:hypothetical protein
MVRKWFGMRRVCNEEGPRIGAMFEGERQGSHTRELKPIKARNSTSLADIKGSLKYYCKLSFIFDVYGFRPITRFQRAGHDAG